MEYVQRYYFVGLLSSLFIANFLIINIHIQSNFLHAIPKFISIGHYYPLASYYNLMVFNPHLHYMPHLFFFFRQYLCSLHIKVFWIMDHPLLTYFLQHLT